MGFSPLPLMEGNLSLLGGGPVGVEDDGVAGRLAEPLLTLLERGVDVEVGVLLKTGLEWLRT